MKDIEYIFNNKIYNLTRSTKLYEYEEREGTGRFINNYEITRTVDIAIYKSLKNNLYKSISSNGRILITDITEEELKRLLSQRSEIELLREFLPCEVDKLEEV